MNVGGSRLRAGFGENVHVSAASFRVPLSSLLLAWLARRTWAGLVWLVRHPVLVGLAALAVYAWQVTATTGPMPVLVVTGLLVTALVGWRVAHPASFSRVLLARIRAGWRSRSVYSYWWQPAMVTGGLALTHAGTERLPRLLRVRSTGSVDVVRVRMLPGQTVTDWTTAGPRLAQTFGLLDCRARTVPGRVHEVDLWCITYDPLTRTVAVPAPATAASASASSSAVSSSSTGVDLAAVPVGRREDGRVFCLRILHTHLLVAGETGAGKGSVIWSVLCGLAPAIRGGVVRVWAIDPKGGMELAFGAPLFNRFLYGGPTATGAAWQEATAELLEDAVRVMQERAARCRGVVRLHTPTTTEPLVLVVIDEVASLTAYVTDAAVRKRLAAALSLLLSQGRAVGVTVIAATQDARKEVLGMRDLFPTRIALRAAEAEQADMVLGAGARVRGARTDQISDRTPGVGYVALDGVPEPVRVRFAHVTDDHIATVVKAYAPDTLTNGAVVPTADGVMA